MHIQFLEMSIRAIARSLYIHLAIILNPHLTLRGEFGLNKIFAIDRVIQIFDTFL